MKIHTVVFRKFFVSRTRLTVRKRIQDPKVWVFAISGISRNDESSIHALNDPSKILVRTYLRNAHTFGAVRRQNTGYAYTNTGSRDKAISWVQGKFCSLASM